MRHNEQQSVVHIVRGLPGSGKSTLANQLSPHVWEADNYHGFYEDGKYVFNSLRLEAAHNWCFRGFCNDILKFGNETCSSIVVSNTGSRRWEVWPYIMFAKSQGWHVNVMYPDTSWAWNPTECAKRTIHRVPLHTITNMLERWEHHSEWR